MSANGPGGILIVMGVCGVGKSALANRLANWLGYLVVEGDDHHNDGARDAMSRGNPLSDAERLPWLDRISTAARSALAGNPGVVIACSALRRSYRDRLRESLPGACFLHLTGHRAIIAKRLSDRRDHFAGVSLLESQLEILEPLASDEAGLVLDVAAPIDAIAGEVLRSLGYALPASPSPHPGRDRVAPRQT